MLQDALTSLRQDRTTVIVAHRFMHCIRHWLQSDTLIKCCEYFGAMQNVRHSSNR